MSTLHLDDSAGSMPSFTTWNDRLGQFRWLESMACDAGMRQGFFVAVEHPQVEGLRRELEHCFAAGAWIACIFLAHSIVETTMKYRGFKTFSEWESDLGRFDLSSGARWLRKIRNSITHRRRHEPAVVTMEAQVFDRDRYRQDAKKAVSIALRVSFATQ